MFRVDVITPVFNNVKYIEKCIDSAHAQEEVNKIIVIDDGSTDGTLELLMSIKPQYDKLEVLTHPGHINKGIACSRNLGLKHAAAEWIAFLDSDDFYLPGRFYFPREILSGDSTIDGIYEPVENRVLSEQGAERFIKSNFTAEGNSVIRIKEDVNPEEVFEAMYFGKGGVVHLNGLTLRRSLAYSVKLFDEELRIVDDSVFRLKVAFKGKLRPGSNEPVAVRTIHDSNNEPNITTYDIYRKYESLMNYFIEWGASKKLVRNSIRKTVFYYLQNKKAVGFFKKLGWSFVFMLKNGRLVFKYLF